MPVDTPTRIILTEDSGTLMTWPTPPTRQIVEDLVTQYAGQGVDVLSYGLLGTHQAIFDSKVCHRQFVDPPGGDTLDARNVRHMVETGLDFPAIIAETSHRHGMQFWPTARMNNAGRTFSQTHADNPDWFFAGYANVYGFAGSYRPMINYEVPAVRQYMLRGFRELVERYDADGLQLDFTRYPALFLAPRAFANTQLLTDYLAEIRSMLDEVGRAKGRRLTFAVQVLAYPHQGIPYGHDIAAWVRNGSVDCLLPSQPNNVDCHLPVDRWCELVSGTDCRVYPTIHPNVRFPWTVENRSTLDSLRAAAHLYYRQGASGLSTVNMFDALQNEWFKHLRDPDKVAEGPHHYRYTFDAEGSSNLSMRPDGLTWRHTTPIHIVDDPAQLTEGYLTLTVTNLTDESELVLFLNGEEIPRLAMGGKRQYPTLSSQKANTSLIELPLSHLKLIRGCNELGVSLNSTRPYAEAWIAVHEVELRVGRLNR